MLVVNAFISIYCNLKKTYCLYINVLVLHIKVIYQIKKYKFPVEYDRMIDLDDVDRSTKLIRDIFLKQLHDSEALPKQRPKTINVQNDRDYYKGIFC